MGMSDEDVVNLSDIDARPLQLGQDAVAAPCVYKQQCSTLALQGEASVIAVSDKGIARAEHRDDIALLRHYRSL